MSTAIPTRFIDKAEFDDLMKLEGGSLPLYKLVAIPFVPPTPEGMEPPEGIIDYDNYKASTIRVLLLNVTEPRLYKDEQGLVFIVLPSYDIVTHEVASTIFPRTDVWCYRFSPYSWDSKDDMDLAAYLFPENTVPNFELNNVETH